MVENITALAINTAGSVLNQIAVGIVILIAGLALGLLVKKVAFRILQEIELNKMMSGLGFTYNAERGISSLLSAAIYLTTIILFLDQFGIKSIVIYILAGGVVLLILLTFLVGLKDVLPNLWGGIIVRRKNSLRAGQYLELPEVSGMVQHLGYLETEIKTKRGDVLYVPNSLLPKNKPRTKT